ncbi:dynein intermediate chain 2, ciliary-like [Argonauta hians]
MSGKRDSSWALDRKSSQHRSRQEDNIKLELLGHRKSFKVDTKLNDAKLNEEFNLVLRPTIKLDSDNLVHFDYNVSRYVPVVINDQIVTLELLSGNLIPPEDYEVQKAARISLDVVDEKEEGEEGENIQEIVEGPKLFNAFNFGDRGTQTFVQRPRDQNTMTDPPPTKTFSDTVNQWVIYDAYVDDNLKQSEKKKVVATNTELDLITVVLMERLVTQNIFKVFANDYKYYEDESDEFHVTYGTLLPLWKFSHPRTLGSSVTSLSWNPHYSDFFGCAFGSHNIFNQKKGGSIMFYSLKNPSHPKHMFHTGSSVMALDIHEEFSYYVCVGLYDGHVLVYNLMLPDDTFVHKSSSSTGKHDYEVTQVKWQQGTQEVELMFCSISTDGKVLLWSLIKTDLIQTLLFKIDNGPLPMWKSDIPFMSFGCCTTIDFHRTLKHLYLIGTQTGKIHVCSKRFGNEVLYTIDAHAMGVNKVEWNYYHPRTFITCSDDWRVKIWDHNKEYKRPIFSYDLGDKVTDVAWAPYSSSAFAASTSKGYVYVYDLNYNRYEPMCAQVVVRKKETEVTRISFNPKNYTILAGDSRGDVTCLKLSPNLRKQPKLRAGELHPQGDEKVDLENIKLDRIFSMAR